MDDTGPGGGMRMFRLLQGDVGSGKTAVAFLAMLKAAEQGSQSCLLAPTEVLTVQHLQVSKVACRRAARGQSGFREEYGKVRYIILIWRRAHKQLRLRLQFLRIFFGAEQIEKYDGNSMLRSSSLFSFASMVSLLSSPLHTHTLRADDSFHGHTNPASGRARKSEGRDAHGRDERQEQAKAARRGWQWRGMGLSLAFSSGRFLFNRSLFCFTGSKRLSEQFVLRK